MPRSAALCLIELSIPAGSNSCNCGIKGKYCDADDATRKNNHLTMVSAGPIGAGLPKLIAAGRWKSAKMPARDTERQAADRGAVDRYYQEEQP